VGLTDALATCRNILEGRYDDVSAEVFYFSGDMAEILSNVGRTQ